MFFFLYPIEPERMCVRTRFHVNSEFDVTRATTLLSTRNVCRRTLRTVIWIPIRVRCIYDEREITKQQLPYYILTSHIIYTIRMQHVNVINEHCLGRQINTDTQTKNKKSNHKKKQTPKYNTYRIASDEWKRNERCPYLICFGLLSVFHVFFCAWFKRENWNDRKHIKTTQMMMMMMMAESCCFARRFKSKFRHTTLRSLAFTS